MAESSRCAVPRCGSDVFIRRHKLCKMHYTRWRRHGAVGRQDVSVEAAARTAVQTAHARSKAARPACASAIARCAPHTIGRQRDVRVALAQPFRRSTVTASFDTKTGGSRPSIAS
jgi:hypothetical protein